jgi:stage II sporulation protein D
MSQVGANYMAKQGYTYTDILKHYYNGIEIEKYR